MRGMTTKEAAEYLGFKPATLIHWRCTGKVLLPYYKINEAVRYRKQDLDAFIAQRMENAPSDATSRIAADLTR